MDDPIEERDQIPEEVDFRQGVRGKHAVQYARDTNVVLLDPDLVAVFPDSDSVNRALRLLVYLAWDQAGSREAA